MSRERIQHTVGLVNAHQETIANELLTVRLARDVILADPSAKPIAEQAMGIIVSRFEVVKDLHSILAMPDGRYRSAPIMEDHSKLTRA